MLENCYFEILKFQKSVELSRIFGNFIESSRNLCTNLEQFWNIFKTYRAFLFWKIRKCTYIVKNLKVRKYCETYEKFLQHFRKMCCRNILDFSGTLYYIIRNISKQNFAWNKIFRNISNIQETFQKNSKTSRKILDYFRFKTNLEKSNFEKFKNSSKTF